ncbi:hypothetical protein KBZ21_40640, partial [Streptomyces sp. A73]|nr:hypothetical protein [Streptomyces sp. A73]
LARLSGGDTPQAAVDDARCLLPPIGCGQPLTANDLTDQETARRGIARFEEEPLDNDPAHREWTAEEDWDQVQADAAFIAHA